MKKLFAITVLSLAFVGGCTDDNRTISTLENAGFTNIRTTGYSMFACGKDDTFRTGFVATNPVGKEVRGTVCCGFLAKGCTIRF